MKLNWALGLLLCAGTLAAAPQRRLAVLIDPGHGGDDPGVSQPGFSEAEYTLALARDLAKQLKTLGVEARLTREDGRGLSLGARVQLANQLKPRAFVSLHVNASFQTGAQGPRVFVPAEGPVDEPAAPLWEQAARLHARASKALGQSLSQRLGASGGRPVQVLKMGVFRGLAVPGCVVELGFATDAATLATLKESSQREALAQRLASGLVSFLRQEAGHAVP